MIRRYLNHQILDFANLICTACNPLESKYVSDKEGKWVAEVNISNCESFLDFYEFEMEAIKTFNEYLIPLTNQVNCEEGAEPLALDPLDTSFVD